MLPETGRSVVGNGNLNPPSYSRAIVPLCTPSKLTPTAANSVALNRTRSFPNPLKSLSLLMAKDNAAVVFAGAFLYTTFCCIPASLGTLFVDVYDLNQLQAGLVYLPFGIGCSLAAVASGKLIDRDYRITAELHGLPIDRLRGDDLLTFPIEKARLRSVFAPLVVAIGTVIAFGWAVERDTVSFRCKHGIVTDRLVASRSASGYPIHFRPLFTDLLQCKQSWSPRKPGSIGQKGTKC